MLLNTLGWSRLLRILSQQYFACLKELSWHLQGLPYFTAKARCEYSEYKWNTLLGQKEKALFVVSIRERFEMSTLGYFKAEMA